MPGTSLNDIRSCEYWHTQQTRGRFCLICSYLTPALNHDLRALHAIHAALTGNPYLAAHPDQHNHSRLRRERTRIFIG